MPTQSQRVQSAAKWDDIDSYPYRKPRCSLIYEISTDFQLKSLPPRGSLLMFCYAAAVVLSPALGFSARE